MDGRIEDVTELSSTNHSFIHGFMHGSVRQTKRGEAPLSVTHGAGRLKWPPPDFTVGGWG